MKILIDIGHPAHVHYFRNFIKMMEEKGHAIFVTARDKEVSFDLLSFYQIKYLNRGKGRKGFWGKLMYILEADLFIWKASRKFKPDVFLSFGSPYLAHVAFLLGKPNIAFDDTDNNFFEHVMYVPFTGNILTPKVYARDYGKKHFRFDGFMELCALHPKYFNPKGISITEGNQIHGLTQPYVLLRFVSWEASHDMGLHGLSLATKYKLVQALAQHARVIISSESPLPEDLQQYAYKIHPALMHDVLAGATLLISESLTMAAECAFAGTPTVCISTAKAGTLDEEVRLGLIELFREETGLLDRVMEMINDRDYKNKFSQKSKEMVEGLIDVTGFMVWFVEHFPGSKKHLLSLQAPLINNQLLIDLNERFYA